MSRAAPSNNDSYADRTSENPSWTHSLESPLVRLNREITNLSSDMADESLLPPPQSVGRHAPDYNTSVASAVKQDASVLPASQKGKGKDTSHPLLRGVLRHNLYSANDSSSFDSKKVSPLKFRAKPKTPVINKSRNPYLSEQASPADWSGIVDLRDPSVLTPKKKARPNKMTATTPYDDDDDSFDGLPPGMSPPVLMSPARPPRSSAELGLLKLGQTPARDATARIQRDLIRDAQLKGGGNKNNIQMFGGKGYYETSTSLSTAMTPPSLSRYNHGNEYSTDSNITKDSSLESMIRHIQNDIRPDARTTSASSTSDLHIRPRTLDQVRVNATGLRSDQPQPQPYSPALLEMATPMYNPVQPQHDDLDSDSDSLDIDEVNNTAHPSAAFLMASQGGQFNDDNSFGSSNNSSDSLGDEDIGATGIVPVHPFAQSGPVVEDDGFDDDDSESFDGFETQPGAVLGSSEYQDETVFGLAPAGRTAPSGDLRMLGDDLDTAIIDRRLGFYRPEEQSPTPNLWAPH